MRSGAHRRSLLGECDREPGHRNGCAAPLLCRRRDRGPRAGRNAIAIVRTGAAARSRSGKGQAGTGRLTWAPAAQGGWRRRGRPIVNAVVRRPASERASRRNQGRDGGVQNRGRYLCSVTASPLGLPRASAPALGIGPIGIVPRIRRPAPRFAPAVVIGFVGKALVRRGHRRTHPPSPMRSCDVRRREEKSDRADRGSRTLEIGRRRASRKCRLC